MMDFVSRHRISVVGVAAATSLFCAMLIPYGLSWAGRAWVGGTRRMGAAQLRLKEEGTP